MRLGHISYNAEETSERKVLPEEGPLPGDSQIHGNKCDFREDQRRELTSAQPDGRVAVATEASGTRCGPTDNRNAPVLGLSLIHISEPTRLGMISYAVFCLKKKKKKKNN